MSYDQLTLIWFVLLGILLSGYAILDGFDLGVGILHPFIAKDDRERRLVMNSIGPLWDGNEVWLVTFGGALFAAFPVAYATVFSSFYTAFFLLLTCLIGRAVSLEFRSKVQSVRWRKIWDFGFFGSSLTAAALLGIAGGNVMAGMELGPKFYYEGSLLSQVYWYPLLVGCLTVSLLHCTAAIYLYLKTEEALQARVRRAITPLFYLFSGLYVCVTSQPGGMSRTRPRTSRLSPALDCSHSQCLGRSQHSPGDVSGETGVRILLVLDGHPGLRVPIQRRRFPELHAVDDRPAYSVTLDNARSSQQTLGTMLIIAAVGIPFVLSYTVTVYWIFRGKVKLDPHSY